MDINAQTLAALMIANKANFQKGFQSRQNANDHLRVATRVPSTSRSNRYPWLGSWPALREWLGERLVKQLAAHSYEIKNKKFESTIGVEAEAIEDDEVGVYAPMFEEMGIAAALWPNETVFSLLKLGETALGYDGKPFFATDHPTAKGDGVYANLAAGGEDPWYLLDSTRALKPLIWQPRIMPQFQAVNRSNDAHVVMEDEFLYGVRARGNAGFGLHQLAYKSHLALDETNFRAARAAMMSQKNDQGQPWNITPNLLVVPPSLELDAEKLIKAVYDASGASNVNMGKAEVLVTTYVAE